MNNNVYLVWSWFGDDEPMVVSVTDTEDKAMAVIEKLKGNDDFDGYEFSIDPRVLNTDTTESDN